MKPEIAEQIERQMALFRPLIIEPEGVRLERGELGGVDVEWTIPESGVTDPDTIVLYTHGGGYSSGLAAWARRGTARLAKALGCKVAAVEYRLSPQFPFPAAHEDVLAVYKHVIGPAGYKPGRVVLIGDSAGGALAVSCAADARDAGLPLPACIITNSLWADIDMNTPSLDDPEKLKHDIRKEIVVMLNHNFLLPGGINPRDPRHSPVYRDLSKLPPILLQAAGLDICYDDSVRLAARAKEGGTPIKFSVYPNVNHIWILNGPWNIKYPDDYPANPAFGWEDSGTEPPECVTAIDEIVAFIKENRK
ncbi:Alpha/Beta hydrolase protein [Hyaloraphidium curvatum]|nr:Alpha/Beta hydrolase protein [Hyaloraphidium curvatum]